MRLAAKEVEEAQERVAVASAELQVGDTTLLRPQCEAALLRDEGCWAGSECQGTSLV